MEAILNRYADELIPLSRESMKPLPEAEELLRTPALSLFPDALHPEAALSGLLLLMGDWDASHKVSQDIDSAEGSYWHGIAHRIEPDSANAGYWFRRVGSHHIFPELRTRTAHILAESTGMEWHLKAEWDPVLFVKWCDQARAEHATEKERLALAIQKAEWSLLFTWCIQSTRVQSSREKA